MKASLLQCCGCQLSFRLELLILYINILHHDRFMFFLERIWNKTWNAHLLFEFCLMQVWYFFECEISRAWVFIPQNPQNSLQTLSLIRTENLHPLAFWIKVEANTKFHPPWIFLLGNMTFGFLNVCKFMLPVASIKIGALIEQTRISDTFAQKLLKLINYTYNQKSRGPTGPDF